MGEYKLKHYRKISILTALVIILQLVFVPVVYGGNESYYTALKPRLYRTKTTYSITNTGENKAINVKAVVLVDAASNSSYQKNVGYRTAPWPSYTYVDSSGNIYAEILIGDMKPGEVKSITVEREVINNGVSYSSDIYKLQTDYSGSF
jgi:hypothetical protein